jgi:tetratricopeptide (TPR) repeat protein
MTPPLHVRLASAAAIVFVVMHLIACGGAENRKLRHLDNGREYLAAANFEKARVEFRNALQIDPNDADARFLHGRALEKLGNIREAAGMYQAAIDSNADHLQARANLGRIFVFAGAPERALEYVAPGLAKAPANADLLTVRAAAKSQQKDLAGALEDGAKALEQDPKNENAIALVAALYRQQGESQKAADLLQRSIKELPQSIELRQVLSTLYISLDEFDSAEAQLKEIVSLKPKDLPAYYQLAIFYSGRKKLDAADRVLRSAIQAAPDAEEPLLVHADFVANWRGSDEGVKTLARYVEQRPENFDLRLGLGALQQRVGSIDDAVATYRAIVDANGTDPPGLNARNRIAAILLSQGNVADAAKLIEEVLTENPRDNDALVLRGNIALENRDPAAAIADLRTVLRDQPESVGLLRSLARAHLANGESALAEENLRQALSFAPSDVAVRLELSALLGQTGRNDQAVPLLEETVRSNPSNAGAREVLVRGYIASGDFAAARVAAQDLITLAPNAAPGHYFSGLLAQNAGKWDEAEKSFARALELAPEAGDTLAALARVRIERGNPAGAELLVRDVIRQQPKNAVAHNLLGEILLSRKAVTEARATFNRAIDVAPKWWLPYRNASLTFLAEGANAQAISIYERGIERTGEVALVADLAALYERLRRPEDAIKQYEALVQKDPRSEVALNNLAMLLVSYRTDQASLDRARDLVAPFANSQNPMLLDTYGWVLVRRGQYAEALPALERAVQLAPNSPALRYHLGMAQMNSGQAERARENLRLALVGAPNFAGVDEAREALKSLTARG